jgi:predicted RNase H-like nuclease (RuvC/YqgF family)
VRRNSANGKKDLKAELEARVWLRLAGFDKDGHVRALTKRNVQLSSQVQHLKETVHALKRHISSLQREKNSVLMRGRELPS